MDTAFFAELKIELSGSGPATELTGTVDSAAACGGPWSPELQHGGPPTALLVRLAEQLAGAAAGRQDLVSARIAAEFLGPVPVAALTVSGRVLRLARGAVLIAAELAADGRACLQARVWLLPDGGALPGGALPGGALPGGALPGGADPSELPSFDMDSFPYARHLEWRAVRGAPYQPGPAAVWTRPRVPLLAGERPSTMQRLALTGDSASGISSLLDWDEWSFANVDLDLHLMRQSQDEWLLMDADTALGTGLALARSTLSDRAGLIGAGMQTLLIRRRT